MKQLLWFRLVSFVLGLVLAAYAASVATAQWMRPPVSTSAFFGNRQSPVTPDQKYATIAASISMDGTILSDIASSLAEKTLNTNPLVDSANAEAQDMAALALAVSPVNATGWLVISTLKGQVSQSTVGTLKMSYFTGAVSPEALAARIKLVATTAAAADEEIRVFAQSDIRAILTRHGRLKPAVVAAYRQANADGKAFLMSATQAVDPKFSEILKQ